MTPDEYQALANRTEYTPDFVRLEGRSPEHNFMIARLIHAQLGLASEAGEIADALKKHIIYGKALDELNVFEEVGDHSWYSALACGAIRRGFEDALARNIDKLKTRYPDKFTQDAALNRDLSAERAALEK
jgi:NTP pyrophosphatase (non-canonical NTP hydrolase)